MHKHSLHEISNTTHIQPLASSFSTGSLGFTNSLNTTSTTSNINNNNNNNNTNTNSNNNNNTNNNTNNNSNNNNNKKILEIILPPTTPQQEGYSPTSLTSNESTSTRVRIAFNEKTTFEALDRLIRTQCKSVLRKAEQDYFLEDKDGDIAPIEGSMPEGIYCLKLCSQSSGEDSGSEEESANFVKSAPLGAKIHKANGHEYIAKHFHAIEICFHCRQPLFGLGKQGYICCKCLAICHKKCHNDYVTPCGEEPKNLPFKCGQCRKYYVEENNTESACMYHPSLSEKNGVCSKCHQNWKKSDGCCPGKHKPLVEHGKKVIRKNVVGSGINQLYTQFSSENGIFKRLSRTTSNSSSKSEAPSAPSSNDEDEDDTEEGREEEAVEDLTPDVKCECECAEHQTTVLNRDFSCSVQELYEMAFSNDAICNTQLFSLLKYTDIEIQPWKVEANNTETRNNKYTMPLTGSFGPKSTSCLLTQTLLWKHDRNCFIIEVSGTTPDVPYGDTFSTSTKYCVTSNSRYSCHVHVGCTVKFSKSAGFAKSIIQSKSVEGLKGYLTQWETILSKRAAQLTQQRARKSKKGAGVDGAVVDNLIDTEDNYSAPVALSEDRVKGTFVLDSPLLTLILGAIVLLLLVASFIMYSRVQDIEQLMDSLVQRKEK